MTEGAEGEVKMSRKVKCQVDSGSNPPGIEPLFFVYGVRDSDSQISFLHAREEIPKRFGRLTSGVHDRLLILNV